MTRKYAFEEIQTVTFLVVVSSRNYLRFIPIMYPTLFHPTLESERMSRTFPQQDLILLDTFSGSESSIGTVHSTQCITQYRGVLCTSLQVTGATCEDRKYKFCENVKK